MQVNDTPSLMFAISLHLLGRFMAPENRGLTPQEVLDLFKDDLTLDNLGSFSDIKRMETD